MRRARRRPTCRRAADARGGEIVALTIETARAGATGVAERRAVVRAAVRRAAAAAARSAARRRALIRALFPRAEVVNGMAAHELCWDKLAMAQRLLERGVADAGDPDHQRSRGGARFRPPTRPGDPQGAALVRRPRPRRRVRRSTSGSIAGEVPGRRYVVELRCRPASAAARARRAELPAAVLPAAAGHRRRPQRRARSRRRSCAPTSSTARSCSGPSAIASSVRRPGDFIINATLRGEATAFCREVSDAAQTLARRAADALGVRIGAVDLIRAGDEGPYVLEADTDGHHMMIDRSSSAARVSRRLRPRPLHRRRPAGAERRRSAPTPPASSAE